MCLCASTWIVRFFANIYLSASRRDYIEQNGWLNDIFVWGMITIKVATDG